MIAEQSANTFGRCKYMKKAIIGKKVGMTQIFDENGRVKKNWFSAGIYYFDNNYL